MNIKEAKMEVEKAVKIYLEKDEFYNPAPMFLLCAVKK